MSCLNLVKWTGTGGAVLYETNGDNESFLQIAANLRDEYRKGLLNL